MSAEATGLQLSITAVADLEKGLSVALGQLRTAATQMQGAMAPVPKAMGEGKQATEGWLGSLKSFRQEQVQQGRQTRFLVNEIASIIPVAGGAKTALEGVAGVAIEGLAGGFGLGLAFESLKLLAEYFRQAEEEAKKLAEANEKAAKDINEAWKKSTIDVARARFVGQGGTAADFDAIIAANEKETELGRNRLRLMQEREALEKQLEKVQARRVFGGAAMDKRKSDIAAIQADIDAVVEQERQAFQTIQNLRALASLSVNETTTKAAEKVKPPAESSREDKGQNSRPEWQRRGQAALDASAREFDKNQALLPGGAKDMAAALKAQFEEMQRAQKAAQDELQKTRDLAVSSGAAIGTALAGAFTQGEKGAARFAAVVLDQAIVAIQAKTAEAAATAMAANGWNPIAAAAAVAAMFAMGRGLVAQIPKREVGGFVTAGRQYVVGERGPEVFTAHSSGAISPNGAGGSGVTLNFYGGVNDGASTMRTFKANERAISRSLRQSSRRMGG